MVGVKTDLDALLLRLTERVDSVEDLVDGWGFDERADPV
jgi:hypothetical protein